MGRMWGSIARSGIIIKKVVSKARLRPNICVGPRCPILEIRPGIAAVGPLDPP